LIRSVDEAGCKTRSNGAPEAVASSGTTLEWRPSAAVSILWTVLGGILTVFAVILFGLFYIIAVQSEPPETFAFNILALLGLAAVVLLVHEGFHGLAALYYGARPTFGAAMLHKFVPALYCTVEGHRFTRGQFIVFALAPLAGISVLGMLAMVVTPWGLWIVFPLAINFGGAIGDLWMTWLVLRQPPDTEIEDLKDGLRFHYATPV
jgi:hypothetical protein